MDRYKADNFWEPLFHLVLTFAVIFLTMVGIMMSDNGPWLYLFVVLLALTTMRLFIIFHDMVHRSYFPTDERETHKKGFNFYVSHFLQPFVMYSSYRWDNVHSRHHKIHGNMNEYDGSKTVFTMSEYNHLPYLFQKVYDLVHIPFLFFPLCSFYVFFFSIILHFDFQFFALFLFLMYALYQIGKKKLLFNVILAMFLAGTIGVMLFHLQHQVNESYYRPFDNDDPIEKKNADLKGSSVLKIPSFLKFFTFGIEYHNVHHFDPGVPGYNTQKCHEELVQRGLIDDHKVSYIQSFKSLFHSYYDDQTQRYVSNSFFKSLGLEA
ncbi:MAG: hypothetical protein EBU93_07605 [Chlamydiae bacterium]|nr:hypothetical protein [Chlamydiota bacterium]